MAYVKLDCGLLDSTLWVDRQARELFITALLMAEPFVAPDPIPQIAVRKLEETGWVAPAGEYGLVSAAGAGIVRRAGVELEAGYDALERLGAPEPDSRSQEHDGRRMIRVNGGYLILNYAKYRNKDHTNAERQRRYRERQRQLDERNGVTDQSNAVTSRYITEAEAEAEAEASKDSPSLRDGAPVGSTDSNGEEKPERVKSKDIEAVFAHWQRVHEHPRSALTQARRTKIAAMLKQYSLEDLCLAIDGYKLSPHHMGENERGTVYDSIELLLRDAKHVDAGLKFLEDGKSYSGLTQRSIRNTRDWVPPEMRTGKNQDASD